MAHILQYDLRPHKQVERRMMIDAFQILLGSGFHIRSYKYLGMGSVFFWDFLMFHKLLGLRDLTSVEKDRDLSLRVDFNRPCRLVQVHMIPIGEALAKIDEQAQYIVWMDYDQMLSSEMLQDAAQAGTRLSSGSVCIITVDVAPPKSEDGKSTLETSFEYYKSVSNTLWDPGWHSGDFHASNLASRVAELLRRAIDGGAAGRNLSFLPMFHFEYRDGDHPMMTIGGMIGTSKELRRIKRSELASAVYYRDNLEHPYTIRIPRFTRRERYLLDREMPRAEKWRPVEFETNDSEIKDYSEIYRFLPAYAELML
jgi:hypothetical protein